MRAAEDRSARLRFVFLARHFDILTRSTGTYVVRVNHRARLGLRVLVPHGSLRLAHGWPGAPADKINAPVHMCTCRSIIILYRISIF